MQILNKDGQNYLIDVVNFIKEEYEVSKVSEVLGSDWLPIYIMIEKNFGSITFEEAKSLEMLTVDDSRLR